MATLTAVSTCTATGCAFNDNGCTAPAITVGGQGAAASCTTFISLDARGGLPTANGQVGACQRLECTYNKDLMCTASSIEVTADADCSSYEAA
ncbi:DUF1540 domain-containing protein [Kocuria rhizophila]|uniref:DUF1540 domain-containing protein n=1 Tax=Kocuria rhizophila TaxID=72000 RepID=UPI0002EBD6B5|nr:DUF1540 domain-containing protein [Kocuria rhizophila]KUP28698.1 hypothetical protein IX41_00075 [Kocuria rhizophila]MBO4144993.1 DUF1540 domain-containing protein [Kocuria rhizophila]MCT1546016.1 DUF1540 domain-containing protein [Kocuria rhizophila]MDR7374904.1 hypothetical protein [Kocuria rhizophila]QTK32252.1 DUF1540 domain-containing protein [Kocuria rhizophila]